MEQLYKDPRTLLRMREGPLGAYVDAFARQLIEEGYARASARYALQRVADLGQWLRRRRMAPPQLTPEHLTRYLEHRSREGHHRSGDAAIVGRLLKVLLDQGIVAQIPPIESTPAERAGDEFRHYLEGERRLAPATVFLYLVHIKRFLAQCFAAGEVRLDALRADDVIGFVQREAAGFHPKRSKVMTAALRSFLQYARYRGFIRIDLSSGIPTVASWTMAELPRALSSEEVQQLLSGCDRQTALGRRNWAILLLLARLGLRAGEVVGLTFEDLDWEAGDLCIRASGASSDRLPLPDEVGAALVEYLRQARPNCSSRRVFVRMRAPHRGFASSAAICSIVRRALERAGLDPPHTGAHLLRHSVATHLLRQGASLTEIGELLATSGDPVGDGLAESLARPGGNVTGVSLQLSELGGKHIELMGDLLPRMRRVALLVDGSGARRQNESYERLAHTAATPRGITVQTFRIDSQEEIRDAFRQMEAQRPDALLAFLSPRLNSLRGEVIRHAANMRLPSIAHQEGFAQDGGLMSYGPSFDEAWRRVAYFVDRILKGAKPSELPIEQPTKFALLVNAKTAKALGVVLPPLILLRAEQVIE